jgi:hypothetical protein
MKDISFFDEHGLAVIPLQPKSKKQPLLADRTDTLKIMNYYKPEFYEERQWK